MTLIKSISGIRGTIGGGAGEGLNPLDIVKFTSAYATLIRKTCKAQSNKIVVGRDARISGEMVKNVVVGTLMGMGWDVVDIDLASTPTTELAVTMEGACGGIILTASHNPKQWNALKLLNEHGEFLNAEEGNEVLRIAEAEEFDYADVDHLGSYRKDLTYNQKHIDSVLALDLVDVEAIKKANFRVAIDCVNSVGGIILPELLERLGVKHVEKLYCEPTGNFQHNPEPLEKNLGDIMNLMKGGKADEKEMEFVFDYEKELETCTIMQDKRWLGEAVINVLDNAIKYSPCGSKIFIRLQKRNYLVRMEIEDQGIGIPQNEYHKIFQRFYRGSSKEVMEKSGTGIGLFLSREIIEKHAGTITVTSGKKKKGSTFVIQLPYVG